MSGSYKNGTIGKLLPFVILVYLAALSLGIILGNEKIKVFSYLIALLLPLTYLLLFKLQWATFLIVLSIPLSFKFMLMGMAISFPAEILAGLVAIFFLVFRLFSTEKLSMKFIRHPLTILVILDLAWLAMASLFSEVPLISMKRVIVRTVYVIVFFFLFSLIFRDFKNITRIWLLYAIGLIIPILSTLYNHSQYEFIKTVSHIVTHPFYNDHTQYATCIAYVLPVLGLVIATPGYFGLKLSHRLSLLPVAALLLAGLVFSWSRAAWLSILAALIFTLLVVFFRFRLWHFMLITILAGAVIYQYRTDIYQRIEKVDAMSRSEDLEEHMESVVNIRTDPSNLERINRWNCAIRMFLDRPLTGFGPGTYQFVYGKYQITSEMTRISTNHGDRGNSHSEYLTYLSETGAIGFLIFNVLILYTMYTGLRIYRSKGSRRFRWLALALLMGFVTYFVHGLFNSFLDTDKASVLVYGSICALVVMDIRAREGEIPEDNLKSMN
jgi:O-antigen ligase